MNNSEYSKDSDIDNINQLASSLFLGEDQQSIDENNSNNSKLVSSSETKIPSNISKSDTPQSTVTATIKVEHPLNVTNKQWFALNLITEVKGSKYFSIEEYIFADLPEKILFKNQAGDQWVIVTRDEFMLLPVELPGLQMMVVDDNIKSLQMVVTARISTPDRDDIFSNAYQMSLEVNKSQPTNSADSNVAEDSDTKNNNALDLEVESPTDVFEENTKNISLSGYIGGSAKMPNSNQFPRLFYELSNIPPTSIVSTVSSKVEVSKIEEKVLVHSKYLSSLSLTPPKNETDDIKIKVRAVVMDENGEGALYSDEKTLEIKLVDSAPIVKLKEKKIVGKVDTNIPLDLSGIKLSSPSGKEQLAVTLSNLPKGTTFVINGVDHVVGEEGKIMLEPEITEKALIPGNLFIRSPVGYMEDFEFRVTAHSIDADGDIVNSDKSPSIAVHIN